jgi:hypothetical protein
LTALVLGVLASGVFYFANENNEARDRLAELERRKDAELARLKKPWFEIGSDGKFKSSTSN